MYLSAPLYFTLKYAVGLDGSAVDPPFANDGEDDIV